MFAENSQPSKAKEDGPSGPNNIMFEKEGDSIQEENTAAAFQRSADRATLNKHQRMQDDIDAYTKTQVKPSIALGMDPDFPVTCNAPTKIENGGMKSASKMVIAQLEKRVESTT